MTRHPSLFQHSAPALAKAYRQAAETARLSPYEDYAKRETRARYYDERAAAIEAEIRGARV